VVDVLNRMDPPSEPCLYRLDAHDAFVFVNTQWLMFARANQPPETAQQSLVGSSLWDFIRDRETSHIYRLLLQRIRATRGRITIPFHADTANQVREMEMELIPFAEGLVQLRSTLVSLRDRGDEPEGRHADPSELLILCSWCSNICTGEGKWADIEVGIRELDLFSMRTLPQLTHGICPSCRDIYLKGLPEGNDI